MRKTKMEKGITPIALIITIVVLLILAVVSIGAVKNSKIIDHAQTAKDDWEKAQNNEFASLNEYEELIKNKLAGKTDASKIGKATVGEKVSKNSTINGEAYSSSNPVIPKGFQAINVTTEGHESYWDAEGGPQVSEGLVISDGNSEFVWIPVPELDAFARLQDGSSENYRGVLYNWYNDSTGKTEYTWSMDSTSYKEPENSNNTYQADFNKMVKSVAQYEGFYVGRYETSLDENNVAMSKKGEYPTNCNYWSSAWRYSLTYSNSANLGVKSEMIWGCQWDAMLKFVLMGDESDHVNNKYYNIDHYLNSMYKTGGTNYESEIDYNDIVSNIFDLEGNMFELTQESNRNGKYCVERRSSQECNLYD